MLKIEAIDAPPLTPDDWDAIEAAYVEMVNRELMDDYLTTLEHEPTEPLPS